MLVLLPLARDVILARKKLMEGVKEGYQEDILNIMLQYEKKNPNYEIEQQVDDFITFFVAGLIPE